MDNIFIEEKLLPRLTFNPGLALTGFRTNRPLAIEIQVFRNENSSQKNAYSRYSNYSYSGLIPNERTETGLSGPNAGIQNEYVYKSKSKES